ncbi:TIGR01458 family HAD-type hydrolase [Agromyces tropicus]|uniref:Haloacid dehalogenase-like hydrolase domain-containing protein 2 n=1 Tax=Agromyces tropicus TaxID=555371 RepID=A0ABP5FJ39_9MICO
MAGILLDLDGVLYVGDEPVPGGAEAVAWMVRERIPHRFLTNTTSRPRPDLVAKLGRLGVEVDAADLLTPVTAAAAWLDREGRRRPALFVPDATAREFGELGVEAAPSAGRTDATRSADTDGPVDAVVVGDLGDAWDFATLNRAFRLLMADAGTPLVALGLTRFWRAEDGLRLDVGAFVRALEYASGREAVVLGKPAREFYLAAARSLDEDAAELVMVGDDIRSDVEGAQRAGMTGVLVRTGKFDAADLDGDASPDAVLDSVADLPGWWRSR